MPRIVIVGGGISGLSIAFRLKQFLPNIQMQLLEGAPTLGGKISTLKQEGFLYETGPNGFLDNNPSTVTLARELGLESELIEANEAASKNRYLFLKGKLRLLPSTPFGMISTDIISWRAKLSLFMERFRSPNLDTADESIDAFAKRRVGEEIAETLVDPFVTGIFAGDSRQISLRSGFPRIHAMETKHGSITAGLKANRQARKASGNKDRPAGRLWSFRNGLGTLISALANRIGLENIIHASACSISHNPSTSTWQTTASNGQTYESEILILTCQAYNQGHLLEPLNPNLSQTLNSIPYNRVAIAVLGFRSGDIPIPLEGFGFLVPGKENRSILGSQWCSSIYTGRAPAGMVLLRVMLGGPDRPELVDLDDEAILQIVYRELQATMMAQAPPLFSRIVRWDKAIPQYHLGHQEKVARIEKELGNHPGLFLGGNALKGIAINDCVENAETMAVRVSRWWNNQAKPAGNP